MSRTVGEVARLAHVTVRTLHHYHQIGLVTPSARSDAGYRLYDTRDLERLQQVLVYRELGFELDRIRELMAAPHHERGAALKEQRTLLAAEADRLRAVLAAVDAAIDAHERGITMEDEQLFEVFGDFDPREHEQEAAHRWGDTDAYRQSAERARRYRKEDWQQVKAEQEAVTERLAQVFRAGEAPDSDVAMDAAEAHRRQIHERFYDCPHEMHVGLGDLYVTDPRFTAFYDEREPGLATFVRDAIRANAARAGVG